MIKQNNYTSIKISSNEKKNFHREEIIAVENNKKLKCYFRNHFAKQSCMKVKTINNIRD